MISNSGRLPAAKVLRVFAMLMSIGAALQIIQTGKETENEADDTPACLKQ